MIESIKFRMWFKYGHSFIVSTMPFHLHSYSFIFHERYDYMTFRKGKVKSRMHFFRYQLNFSSSFLF